MTGPKRKAANTVTQPHETRELVSALRDLASECLSAASQCALIVQADYWERNAQQLRFVAALAQDGHDSPYLPMAADWLTAGRRLLDGHALAVAAMPPLVDLLTEADAIAMDEIHRASQARRR